VLHIEYQNIVSDLVMAEHHFISGLLSDEQQSDLNEETKLIMNPVRKTEYGYARLNHVVFTLGMACTLIGLREITKDNYQDFFKRINIFERLCGNFMTRSFNLNDIQLHIGLSVNGSNYSDFAFLKNMVKNHGKDAVRCALNNEPVEGSTYDHNEGGVMNILWDYQDSYGDALVSEAPKEEE